MYGNTRAVITVSEMTIDDAMRLINEKHARATLAPDQVYVFRMILSNQRIDSYQTRMSESTLRNYGIDFTQGRALMNSHRAGGFDGAELPIGRTFATQLEGQFLPSNAQYESTGGADLAVYSYIQRGLKITDVATNDLIGGIDGGTINDVSVGFRIGVDGQYRCSLCGSNLMDWEGCTHVPGARYDNGRCFAWVENARGREASLVYAGATPGAMIDKAVRMVETGRLGRGDALLLEEEWGVRIVSGKTLAIVKPEPRKENAMNWQELLESLRAVDAKLADQVTALGEDERPGALVAAIREKHDQLSASQRTEGELKKRADLGDKWLDSLVKEAVEARVRAEGAEAFDAEKYGKLLRGSNDPEFIQSEIKSHQARAKSVFGTGKRPTVEAQPRTVRGYRRA